MCPFSGGVKKKKTVDALEGFCQSVSVADVKLNLPCSSL